MGTDDQATLIYRIDLCEKMVQQLRDQLQQYVTTKESERELRSIRDTVDRIEKEIVAMKAQLTDVSKQLTSQELELQKRDADQQKSQDQLQIRVLWGAFSIIVTLAVLLIVAYVTHLLH